MTNRFDRSEPASSQPYTLGSQLYEWIASKLAGKPNDPQTEAERPGLLRAHSLPTARKEGLVPASNSQRGEHVEPAAPIPLSDYLEDFGRRARMRQEMDETSRELKAFVADMKACNITDLRLTAKLTPEQEACRTGKVKARLGLSDR